MKNEKHKIFGFYMIVAISVFLATISIYTKPTSHIMMPSSFSEPLDYEVVTLDEAKTRTNYDFKIPIYLPENWELKTVMLDDNDIFLFYSDEDISFYNFPRPDISGTPKMTITIHEWVPFSERGIEKVPLEIKDEIDTRMNEYESIRLINDVKSYCREQRWTTEYPTMNGKKVLLPSRAYFHTDEVAYGFTADLNLEELIKVVQSLESS
ncbi:MAG: hypothetical protein KAX31_04565 [Thermoplasmata archaeon]|nr:hypothetical protein [Thermoplasmata archaeon]